MLPLHASTLLTLSTMSICTFALPTQLTTPAITLLQPLRSDLHCGMIACPGGNPEGHAFCETIGCDYCVMVVSSPPTTHYECDGLRAATGDAPLTSGRKWNGSIAAVPRRYPGGVKLDE